MVARGDIAALRVFSRKGEDKSKAEDRSERVAKLRRLLNEKERPKKAASLRSSSKELKRDTLTFTLGWKHYSLIRENFVQKRKNRGGGTRKKALQKDASKEEILKVLEDTFFPTGENFGICLANCVSFVGNFKGECIDNLIDDGKEVAFTPARYKSITGFNEPTLYLLTKEKIDCDSETSENETSDLGIPDPEPIFPTLESVIGPKTSTPIESSNLIGTTEERSTFFHELEEDYKESERIDKEKDARGERRKKALEEELLIAKNEKERLESVRLERSSAVPIQPAQGEPCVVINIRHPSLNIVSRAFDPNATFRDVYNWAGSLSVTPEYFNLYSFPKNLISPLDLIQAGLGILNMSQWDGEGECPLFNMEVKTDEDDEEEKEVFLNFGKNTDATESSKETLDDTVPIIESVQTLDDTVLITESVQDLWDSLQEKRAEAVSKLNGFELKVVKRDNITEDILNIYSSPSILTKNLSFALDGSGASGDGVAKEVFSLFWDIFLARFGEGSLQYIIPGNPSLTDEKLEAVGRVITHQFLLTNTFPVELCSSSICSIIDETFREDVSLSFLSLLPYKQRKIVETAIKAPGQTAVTDYQIIADMLGEFGCQSRVGEHNVVRVVHEIAVFNVITKPRGTMTSIRRGMGSFWDNIAAKEIQSLYERCLPTAERVVSVLTIEETTVQEQKIGRWLVWYINNLTEESIMHFLRFCTASSMLEPGKNILVRFEHMAETVMRPKSQTCFKILTIPRNYQTYHQMKINLDRYLNPSSWDLED